MMRMLIVAPHRSFSYGRREKILDWLGMEIKEPNCFQVQFAPIEQSLDEIIRSFDPNTIIVLLSIEEEEEYMDRVIGKLSQEMETVFQVLYYQPDEHWDLVETETTTTSINDPAHPEMIQVIASRLAHKTDTLTDTGFFICP